MLNRIFQYFVFSSLFIALCSVLMVHQSNDLLHLNYDHTLYFLFVFFSTICSYNLHWYFTPEQHSENKRIRWTHNHKSLHVILVILGLAGAGITGIYLFPYWPWLAGAVALTFLYTAPKLPFAFSAWLRKVAIGKTIYLSFVWVYVTAVLPIVLDGNNWNETKILFTVARFFLIYAICIIFDYRDREEDRKEGIRSMITIFNEKGIDRLFYISLLICILLTAALYYFSLPVPVIAALLAPAIITGLLYRRSKRQLSDYFYYFLLDGLMMASALITPFLSF